jgi:hypothetical protein
MRCPKCGYISFDHNQICPKCNKDISDEQAKLNLPAYKSNPPALLGMLVGAGDESSVGFTLDSDAALRKSGMGLDYNDTASLMESGRFDLGGDDQDLEISLTDDTGEFELPELDMDAQAGDVSDIEVGSEEEELSLDMDEVSFEDSDDTSDDLELGLGEVSMEDKLEDSEPADSLDGISPNDSFVLERMKDLSSESAEETIGFDAISREDMPLDDGQSTVELNVSDLKINETGELEINSIPDEVFAQSNISGEDEIKIDEIDIDSEEGLEMNASSKLDDKNETGVLELDDLIIEDDEDMNAASISDDEDSFDLGNLALDNNETGELKLSDLEESKDDLSIDLENLDLDLELDDTEDK